MASRGGHQHAHSARKTFRFIREATSDREGPNPLPEFGIRFLLRDPLEYCHILCKICVNRHDEPRARTRTYAHTYIRDNRHYKNLR